MELCSDTHDEIVFDGGECPLCKLGEDVQRLKDEFETKLDVTLDTTREMLSKFNEAETSGEFRVSEAWLKDKLGELEGHLDGLNGESWPV